MFENLVKRLVSEHLGEYFSYSDLKFEGLARHVQIHGLVLNSDLLPKNLPVCLKLCRIGLVEVDVVPLNLFSAAGSHAVKVVVNDVQVELEELSSSEWDEHAEFETLKWISLAAKKAMRESVFEAIIGQLSNIKTSIDPQKNKEPSSMSFLRKMIARLTSNIKVVINSINISYRFCSRKRKDKDNSLWEHRINVFVRSFELDNTPLRPKIITKKDTDDTIAGIKVNPVEGAANYLINKQIYIRDVGVKWTVYKNSEEVENKAKSKEWDLLSPFCLELILSVNLAGNPGPTAGIAEVRMSPLNIRINPTQVTSIIVLLDSLMEYLKWKYWVKTKYVQTIETGLSSKERLMYMETNRRLLTLMLSGKDISNDSVLTSDRKDKKDESFIEDSLGINDLCWMERMEIKSDFSVLQFLLHSALETLSQTEKKRFEDSWNLKKRKNSSKRWSNRSIRSKLRSAYLFTEALGKNVSTRDDDKKNVRKLAIFNAIDRDNSGDIDADELQLGLSDHGTKLSMQSIYDLIEKFDTDESGTINFEEFCEIFEMSNLYMASGHRTKDPVIALSVKIQEVNIFIGCDYPKKDKCLKLQINDLIVSAAIEGVDKIFVGQKGLEAHVGSINCKAKNGNIAENFILTNKKKLHRNRKEQDNEGKGKSALKKSKITISVIGLKLFQDTQGDVYEENSEPVRINPFCHISDSFEKAITHVCTKKPRKINHPNGREEIYSFVTPAKFKDRDCLSCIWQHEPDDKSDESIVVQVWNKSTHSKSVFQTQYEPTKIENDDDIIARGVINFKIPTAKEIDFSRVANSSYSFDEWYPLDEGKGQILLSVHRELVNDEQVNDKSCINTQTDDSSAAPKLALIHVEVAATTSPGLLDAAIGLTMSKLSLTVKSNSWEILQGIYKEYNKFLLPDAYTSMKTLGALACPKWRYSKTTITSKILTCKGKRLRVCEFTCGSESIASQSSICFSETEYIIGSAQNLEQLYSSDKEARIMIRLETDTGEEFLGSVKLEDMFAALRDGHNDMRFIEGWFELSTNEVLDFRLDSKNLDHLNDADDGSLLVQMHFHVIQNNDTELAPETTDTFVSSDFSYQAPGDLLGVTRFPDLSERPLVNINLDLLSVTGAIPVAFRPFIVVQCYGASEEIQLSNDGKVSTCSFGPLPLGVLNPKLSDDIVLNINANNSSTDTVDISRLEISELYSKACGVDIDNANPLQFLSFLEADYGDAKSTIIDVPLHPPFSDSDRPLEMAGKVAGIKMQIQITFSKAKKSVITRPKSLLPFQPNISLLADIRLPDVIIPAETPLCYCKDDIRVRFGRSQIRAEISDGACSSNVSNLSIYQRTETSTFTGSDSLVRDNNNGAEPETIAANLGGRNSTNSQVLSCSTMFSSEYESQSTNSYQSTIGSISEIESTISPEEMPQGVYNEDIGVSIDSLELRFETRPKRRQHGRYLKIWAFTCAQVDLALTLSIHLEIGLSFTFSMGIGSLFLIDYQQQHNILGHKLSDSDDISQTGYKQVYINVRYGTVNESFEHVDDVLIPTLSVSVTVNEMFFLATAAIVLGGNVLKLFPRIKLTDDDKEKENDLISKANEPPAQIIEDDSAMMLFPLTGMNIALSIEKLEVHMMNRRELGYNGRNVMRYPPKSAVLFLSLSVEYLLKSAIFHDEIMYGQDQGQVRKVEGGPVLEYFRISVKDIRLAVMRSRLKRHMYLDIPDDFHSGDNVLIQPFTVDVSMRTCRTPFDHSDKVYLSTGQVSRKVSFELNGMELQCDTSDLKFLVQVGQIHLSLLALTEADLKIKVDVDGRQLHRYFGSEIDEGGFDARESFETASVTHSFSGSAKSVNHKVPEAKQPSNIDMEENHFSIPCWISIAVLPMFVLVPQGYKLPLSARSKKYNPLTSIQETRLWLNKASKELLELTMNEIPHTELIVLIERVYVGIGNNIEGYPSPFLRISIPEIELTGGSNSNFMNEFELSGHLDLNCGFFNRTSNCWEPLVEPWTLRYRIRRNKKRQYESNTQNIFSPIVMQVSAPNRLNISMSDALFTDLAEFLFCINPYHFEPDDERLHGTYCPNWVVNETGYDVQVWPVASLDKPCDKELMDKFSTTVKNDKAGKLHLHDTKRIRSAGKLLLQHMRILQHKKQNQQKKIRMSLKRRNSTTGKEKLVIEEEEQEIRIESPAELNADVEKSLLTELFSLLDEDDSGEVSAHELHRALIRTGEHISIEEVLYEIGHLDELGVENVDIENTQIDLNEFLSFFSNDYMNIEHIDNEHNDKVCRKSLESCCLALSIGGNEVYLAPADNVGSYMLLPEYEREATQKKKESQRKVSQLLGLSKRSLGLSKRRNEIIDSSKIGNHIIARVQTIGRSTAGNVLFLETPVKLENELPVALEVYITFISEGDTPLILEPELLFTVMPGTDRFVPMAYLHRSGFQLSFKPLPFHYASEGRAEGLADRDGRRVMKRRSSRTSSFDSIGSNTLSAKSGDDSVSSVLSKEEANWKRTKNLIKIQDNNLNVLKEDRPADMCMGIDESKRLLHATRIETDRDFDGGKWSGELDNEAWPFECMMLTHEHHHRKFEFREVITIKVVEAHGLRAADSNGKSDPYVTINCGPEKCKTHHINKELNPVWNSTFRLGEKYDLSDENEMVIKVTDYDALSKNDVLGYVYIKVGWLKQELSKSYRDIQRGRTRGTTFSEEGRELLSNRKSKLLYKQFQLEGGKGVKDNKVKGWLKLGFAYEEFSVCSETPMDCIQYSFSFHPTYTIENLLPYTVDILFSLCEPTEDRVKPTKNQENRLLRSKIVTVHAGGVFAGYDIDGILFDFLMDTESKSNNNNQRSSRFSLIDNTEEKENINRRVRLKIQVRINGSEKDSAQTLWSSPILKSNSSINLAEEKEGKSWDKTEGYFACICAEVSKKLNVDGGARRLTIYAPFWIVNKSDVELNYSDPRVRFPLRSHRRGIRLLCLEKDCRLRVSADVNGTTLLSKPKQIDLLNNSDIHVNDGRIKLQSPSSKGKNVKNSEGKLLIILKRFESEGLHMDDNISIFADVNNVSKICQAAPSKKVSTHGVIDWSYSHGSRIILNDIPDPTSLEHLKFRIVSGVRVSVGDNQEAAKFKVSLAGLDMKEKDKAFSEMPLTCNFSLEKEGKSHRSKLELHLIYCLNSDHSSGRELGIEVQPLGEVHVRSKLVTFTPKFLFANLSDMDILVRQKGNERSAVLIPANSSESAHLPFHFSPDYSVREIQMRLTLPFAKWTPSFRIEDIEDFPLQLRNSAGERRHQIFVDMNRVGASHFIVLRPLPIETIPLTVNNTTDSSNVYFFQTLKENLNIIPGKKSKTDLSLKPDLVLPGEKLAFALDYPMVNIGSDRSQESLRIALSSVEVGYTSSPMRSKKGKIPPGYTTVRFVPGMQKTITNSRGIRQRVQVDKIGSQLVLTVSEFEGAPTSQSLSTKGNNIPENVFAEIALHLSSVGISFLSTSKKTEIAYILAQRIHFEGSCALDVEAKSNIVSGDFGLGHIQIDSSQTNAKYEVMLGSRGKHLRQKTETKKGNEKEYKEEDIICCVSEHSKNYGVLFSEQLRMIRNRFDALRFQLVMSLPHQAGTFVTIKVLKFALMPIDIRLDDVLLSGVLSTIRPLIKSTRDMLISPQAGGEEFDMEEISSRNSPWMNAVVTFVNKEIEVPIQDNVFIERTEIQSFFINLTVQLGSAEQIRQSLEEYGINLSGFLLNTISKLTRLEAFNFDIRQKTYKGMFSASVGQKYLGVLINSFLRQLHEVLLNRVKMASNSVGLTRLKKYEKVRQTRTLEADGAIVAYGPSSKPAHLAHEDLKRAVRVIECWYVRILQRRSSDDAQQDVSQFPHLGQGLNYQNPKRKKECRLM